jgi:imidazolonepropionase-like amidohydrolase
LKCITINPAEILGLDNRLGSLDPGKDADIVIWSGHPFDYYSKVEKAFINGKEISLEKS